MSEFIGRSEELAKLSEYVEDPKFRACAVIGRRRIGKTRLIREFIKNRESIYIQFLPTAELNLERAKDAFLDFTGTVIDTDNFASFFVKLGDAVKNRRVIIVFDEFPYMANSDKTFAGVLQEFIDHRIGESFLILSGSSVHMMESEVSDYSRPLYGRVRKMYVDEIPFREALLFHPNFSDLDSLRLYLTVGGVPYYLEDTPAENYKEYVTKYILSDRGIFNDDGLGVLKTEVPNVEICSGILEAIASGRREIKEISHYLNRDRNLCVKDIKLLLSLNIIGREIPMMGASTKPSLYYIKERMTAFRFHVIRRLIKNGPDPEVVYESSLPAIQTYHGLAFERFCTELISDTYPVVNMGKWWGKVPKIVDGTVVRGEDGKVAVDNVDIDVVAEIWKDGHTSNLFVECKFRSEPVGMSDLEELRYRVSCIHNVSNAHYLLISRGGFTGELRDCESYGTVMLADLDCVTGRKKMPEYRRFFSYRIQSFISENTLSEYPTMSSTGIPAMSEA